MKAAEVAETRTGVAIGSLDFKKPAFSWRCRSSKRGNSLIFSVFVHLFGHVWLFRANHTEKPSVLSQKVGAAVALES